MDYDSEELVIFKYKNWQGKISWRRIIPISLRFGSTKWHPEEQWLLKGFDLDKQANREFAFKDIYFVAAVLTESTVRIFASGRSFDHECHITNRLDNRRQQNRLHHAHVIADEDTRTA